MASDRPHLLTVLEAEAALRAHQVSAVELVRDILDRIEETESTIHAYALVTADQALDQARRADEVLRSRLDVPPLIGIPVGIKDVIETADIRTECGSRVHSGYVPSADAEVVRRLKAAGAIIVGKTVTHEFAFDVFSPPARCPWDPDCIPGGSSGGSGGAVAADSCLFAVGTDTGCSIRNPASINGVVGLKPTFGTVSRTGVIPVSWTCDHVGPITKTVSDARLILQIMCGHDDRDESSVTVPTSGCGGDQSNHRKRLRVGVPTNYFFDGLAEDVERVVRAAIDLLGSLEFDLVDVTVPQMELALPTIGVLSMVESSAYHGTSLREMPELYSPDSRARLEAGELIPGTAYVDAQRCRNVVRKSLRTTFDSMSLDILAIPTCPLTALPVGQSHVLGGDGVAVPVVAEYARLTCPFNLSGQPAITIPCGFDSQEHPVGLQIIGRPFEEAAVLTAAQAYESVTNWHTLRVPL